MNVGINFRIIALISAASLETGLPMLSIYSCLNSRVYSDIVGVNLSKKLNIFPDFENYEAIF